MRNTLYEGYRGIRLPKKLQLQRIRQVVEGELTPLQRQTLLEYYFSQKSVTQIAGERGVHKSTVSRTLRRAEEKLRRFLRY